MNEKIYNTIKQRILSLHYEPGQSLNKKELADELGVSQTPIREIFLRLEWEKLVTIMPRVGIMVTKIDFQELKEVYRCRILIEGEVGKLVAKNITKAQLSEMKRLLEVCRKIKENRTREKLVKLDRQFRKILFQAASSSTLQEISDMLYNQTLRVWYITFDSTDILSEVNMEASEIEETIAALSKRDPDIARELRSKVIMKWVARSYKFYTSY